MQPWSPSYKLPWCRRFPRKLLNSTRGMDRPIPPKTSESPHKIAKRKIPLPCAIINEIPWNPDSFRHPLGKTPRSVCIRRPTFLRKTTYYHKLTAFSVFFFLPGLSSRRPRRGGRARQATTAPAPAKRTGTASGGVAAAAASRRSETSSASSNRGFTSGAT